MTEFDKPLDPERAGLLIEVRNLAAAVADLARLAMPRAEVERRRKWMTVAVMVELIALVLAFGFIYNNIETNRELQLQQRQSSYTACADRNNQIQGFLDESRKGRPRIVIPPVNCAVYLNPPVETLPSP